MTPTEDTLPTERLSALLDGGEEQWVQACALAEALGEEGEEALICAVVRKSLGPVTTVFFHRATYGTRNTTSVYGSNCTLYLGSAIYPVFERVRLRRGGTESQLSEGLWTTP